MASAASCNSLGFAISSSQMIRDRWKAVGQPATDKRRRRLNNSSKLRYAHICGTKIVGRLPDDADAPIRFLRNFPLNLVQRYAAQSVCQPEQSKSRRCGSLSDIHGTRLILGQLESRPQSDVE